MEGVAAALGGQFRLIYTDLSPPYKWLAPYRLAERAATKDPQIAPPFPDMVIASGRQAVPHARFIKRALSLDSPELLYCLAGRSVARPTRTRNALQIYSYWALHHILRRCDHVPAPVRRYDSRRR